MLNCKMERLRAEDGRLSGGLIRGSPWSKYHSYCPLLFRLLGGDINCFEKGLLEFELSDEVALTLFGILNVLCAPSNLPFESVCVLADHILERMTI